ncbi:uncharacterized protein LOC117783272 isoform X3 [Drosophila innubila]|uniref:uncharacterized protein LOC117783272 isoform X3 n=1 Tax=Drosophila innubila TaxID=198719 RepID=UPI00148E78CA|nr:uncharacterized protein LOC117783272 isoform X3 [Drosophila innubila]
MSSTPSSDAVAKLAKPATPSPSLKVYDFDFTGTKFEMDASISEEERRFYLKMYPTVDIVNQRKVHCTVCRTHIGTAANSESNIKMHPILRVTHCVKCHDFYNSGEFSKGEDGSELYCRWCGQGGEVYCCSTCPFVFCKSCIVKNLSRGVIVDIEQNENWNCFKCTSKILWPLRAQHWALVNYIETQKNGLQTIPLPEGELRRLMSKDGSNCCRLAKAKANSLSDSMESLESNASKRSHASSVNSAKKASKPQGPPAKRPKSSNDEVVCTPDLLSMLEPDCQISVAQKPAARNVAPSSNITTTPRIMTVQQNYTGPSPTPGPSTSISNGNTSVTPRSSLPPPLVLSSSGMRYRQPAAPASVVRRTVVPNAIRTPGPVFHTINGFRVDLNSAAQQDSYRLPNGRLIQVKRQVPLGGQPSTTLASAPLSVSPQVIIRQRPAPPQPRMMSNNPGFGSNMGIYNPQTNQQQRAPQIVRVNNGSQVHSVNLPPTSSATTAPNSNGGTTIMMTPASVAKGPTLVRHMFPNTAIGTARSQLQDQIFNAMEICTHLTGKLQTLTHSNAYNQARSYTDLKELYIHLSYLMTYAIGRFKQRQDKCLVDMREMGFKNDANSLENGQLAAEKQASDDEDNEIEIVEPKTDTITIDSDNEEERPSTSAAINLPKGLRITSVKSAAAAEALVKKDPVTNTMDMDTDIDVAAFSSTILASLLEVDITEGSGEVKTKPSVSPGGTVHKKQPRKKTTNKPNPALLHLERQRMEEIKKNDAKLKMKVIVKLRRAEEEHEVARKWIEEQKKIATEKVEKHNLESEIENKTKSKSVGNNESTETLNDKSDLSYEEATEKNHDKLNESKDMDTRSNEEKTKTSEEKLPSTKKSPKEIDTLDSKETTSSKDTESIKTADEVNKLTEVLIEKDFKSSEDKKETENIDSTRNELPAEEAMETETSEDYTSKTTENIKSAVDNADDIEASNEVNKNDLLVSESDTIDGIAGDDGSTKCDSITSATKTVDEKNPAENAEKDSSKTDSVLPAEKEDEEITATNAENVENIKAESETRKTQATVGATNVETEAKDVEEPSGENTKNSSEKAPTSLATF